jgi:hypothetical protein
MLVLLHGVRVAPTRLVAPLIVPSGWDRLCASPFLGVFRGVRAVVDGYTVRLGGLVLVDSVPLFGPVVGCLVPGWDSGSPTLPPSRVLASLISY